MLGNAVKFKGNYGIIPGNVRKYLEMKTLRCNNARLQIFEHTQNYRETSTIRQPYVGKSQEIFRNVGNSQTAFSESSWQCKEHGEKMCAQSVIFGTRIHQTNKSNLSLGPTKNNQKSGFLDIFAKKMADFQRSSNLTQRMYTVRLTLPNLYSEKSISILNPKKWLFLVISCKNDWFQRSSKGTPRVL